MISKFRLRSGYKSVLMVNLYQHKAKKLYIVPLIFYDSLSICNYMRFIVFLVLILSLNSMLVGQQPILVKDINPGTLAVSSGFHPHIQIQDVIYFVGDISGLRDLYALKNGNVELISKMCPGNCSSFKVYFFEFNGKLYFKKQIDNKTNQLWETDGTESGTQLVFEYNGTFKNYALGNNSKIYLGFNNQTSFKDEVFISDGTTNGTKKIGTDISLVSGSLNYELGIAFVAMSNDSLKIFKYEDEILSQLAKIKVSKGAFVTDFKTIYTNDLVILLNSDDSSVSEVFRYDGITKTIKKELNLPFNKQKYPYLKVFSQDTLILYHLDGGHFILTGKPLVKENITPYSHSSFNSTIEDYYHKHNKNAAYLAVENCGDICWKYKFVFFNGNFGDMKEIEILNVDGHGWVGYKNYVFNAANNSTGKEGQLYYFDMEAKSNKKIYQFNQSFSSGGLIPIGFVNGKLYFLANLNQSFGKELYYIETGIVSSTNEQASKFDDTFKFLQKGSTFIVQSEENINCDLSVQFFDQIGRSVYSQNIKANIEYPFNENLKGIYFINILDKKTNTNKSIPVFIQ